MGETDDVRKLQDEFPERHPAPLMRALQRVIHSCVQLTVPVVLLGLLGVTDAIVHDLADVQTVHVFAIAIVVVARGVAYWLIGNSSQPCAVPTELKSG